MSRKFIRRLDHADWVKDQLGTLVVSKNAFRCRQVDTGLSVFLWGEDLNLEAFRAHSWLPSGDKPGICWVWESSIAKLELQLTLDPEPRDSPWADSHYSMTCPQSQQRIQLAAHAVVTHPYEPAIHS